MSAAAAYRTRKIVAKGGPVITVPVAAVAKAGCDAFELVEHRVRAASATPKPRLVVRDNGDGTLVEELGVGYIPSKRLMACPSEDGIIAVSASQLMNLVALNAHFSKWDMERHMMRPRYHHYSREEHKYVPMTDAEEIAGDETPPPTLPSPRGPDSCHSFEEETNARRVVKSDMSVPAGYHGPYSLRMWYGAGYNNDYPRRVWSDQDTRWGVVELSPQERAIDPEDTARIRAAEKETKLESLLEQAASRLVVSVTRDALAEVHAVANFFGFMKNYDEAMTAKESGVALDWQHRRALSWMDNITRMQSYPIGWREYASENRAKLGGGGSPAINRMLSVFPFRYGV